MKKSLIALAALAAAGAANAQSSVTLYGVADVAMRYATHAASGANSQVVTTNSAAQGSTSNLSMISGGYSSSRWGLSGTEDLGGGLKAIFNLENRFNIDNGQPSLSSGSDGSAFRQAWVGLSTPAGNVTLGRQYSVTFDALLGNYASFGNMSSYQPDINMTGVRQYSGSSAYTSATSGHDGYIVSNAIKYSGNFAGVRVSAQYGLGEQASNANGNVYGKGSTLGLRLGYAAGPVAIDGAVEQITGGNGANFNNKARVYTLGGTVKAGSAKINAGWVGRSVAGSLAAPALAAGGVVSQAFTADVSNQKHVNANIYFGGLTFQATPALTLGGQVWYTKSDAAFENRITQGALLVDYSLSKRSDVYIQTDYMLRAPKDDAGIVYKKPFATMLGLRHKF